jgi:hypothetical protein
MAAVTSPDRASHRPPRRMQHRSGLAGLRPLSDWELHPGVRSDDRLSRGERAADLVRDRLGSWFVTLVGAILLGSGVVMAVSGGRAGLVAVLGVWLSGLVLVNLSLVLMAARRAARTAVELALYNLESDRWAAAAIADLRDEVERLRGDLARLAARLQTSGQIDRAGDP